MSTARAVVPELPFWEQMVTLCRILDGVVTFVTTIGDKALRQTRNQVKS